MELVFCRKCGLLRDTRVSTTRRPVDGPAAARSEILTTRLHCEVCHTLLRSEDTEVPLHREPPAPA